MHLISSISESAHDKCLFCRHILNKLNDFRAEAKNNNNEKTKKKKENELHEIEWIQ